MPLVSEDLHGSIIVDDRYAPLVVTTYVGQIGLNQGLWYEASMRELVQVEYTKGHRIVNIHDARRSARATPEMRRFWADFGSRNEVLLDAKTLSNPIVVSSAVLRGAITAVGWLNPRVAKLEVFSSLDEAISSSVALLLRTGASIQLPPSGYQLPPGTRRAQVAT
jgi:hypothetical protein